MIIKNPLALIRFAGKNKWKPVYSSNEARGISADYIIRTGRNASQDDYYVLKECLCGSDQGHFMILMADPESGE